MWNRIKNYEGETFHTVSGLPFTYKVIDDNTIRPYRDDKPMWNITIENLEKALTIFQRKSVLHTACVVLWESRYLNRLTDI